MRLRFAIHAERYILVLFAKELIIKSKRKGVRKRELALTRINN
jgi:hypothetical protein